MKKSQKNKPLKSDLFLKNSLIISFSQFLHFNVSKQIKISVFQRKSQTKNSCDIAPFSILHEDGCWGVHGVHATAALVVSVLHGLGQGRNGSAGQVRTTGNATGHGPEKINFVKLYFLQRGSEIWTHLDFECSKKRLVYKWSQFGMASEMTKNGHQLVQWGLKFWTHFANQCFIIRNLNGPFLNGLDHLKRNYIRWQPSCLFTM